MPILSLMNGHVYKITEEQHKAIIRQKSGFVFIAENISINLSSITDIAPEDVYYAQEKITLRNRGLKRCQKCLTISTLSKLCECETGSSIERLREINFRNDNSYLPEILRLAEQKQLK